MTTATSRLPLYAHSGSPHLVDPTSGSNGGGVRSSRTAATKTEYKSSDARLDDAIRLCDQLDSELNVLENSGHTRLGAFAKPLVPKCDIRVNGGSVANDTTDASSSSLLDDECADPFYDQFFDDDSRQTLFEQLLRGRMRILALVKMVHGRVSLPYARAEIELAETYARIHLWKQGNIHMATASELLKALGAASLEEPHRTHKRDCWPLSRTLERLHALQQRGDNRSRGQLTLDDALALFADVCSDDDTPQPHAPLTTESLCDVFAASPQPAMHWQQLLLTLERSNAQFQNYLARLERAAPASALQLVRSHFDSLDLANDHVVPFHAFVARLRASVESQRAGSSCIGSSVGDASDVCNTSYLTALCVSLELLLERYAHHSLTWLEVVELGGSRALYDDAIDALAPRIQLFLGRLCLQRGQLDDAVRRTQLALARHEQHVGAESASLVPFYLVLAEAMAVRFKQLGVLAQQRALEAATKWFATADGSRTLRARAIDAIDTECARSGVVLPKRDAEARARDALVLEHSTSALVRPDAAMIDDAIELCTKAYALEEQHCGRDHIRTAAALVTLAQIYALKQETSESVRYYTKAIEIYERACNGPVPASAFLQLEVARLLQTPTQNQTLTQRESSAAARAMFMRVGAFFVSFAGEFAGAATTKRACCAQAIEAYRACIALLTASSASLMHGGAQEEQRVVLEAMLRAATDGYGECSLEASDAAHALGKLLLDVGNLRSAETHLRTASAIAETHFGPTDRRARRLRQDVLDVSAKVRAATLNPDEGGDDNDHTWLTL